MEIFNIHIFEFLLIASLALVVFGPERLPEVGRFLGKQLARFLAWQQQSPELKMINDIRGEFEREIADLRDELVRTRTQLDLSKETAALKQELQPMLNLKGDLKAEAAPASAPGAEPPGAAAPEAAPAPEAPPAALPAEAPPPPEAPPAPADPQVALAETPADALARRRVASEPPHRRGLHDAVDTGAPPQPANGASAPAASGAAPEDEQLLARLATLSGDLQALVAELQSRGLLGPDWRAPSQHSHAQETVSP